MNVSQLQPEQIIELIKQVTTIKAFLLAIVILLGLLVMRTESKYGTGAQKLASLLLPLLLLLLGVSISIFCWTQ